MNSETEPMIYGFLRTKAIGLGATLFALNGWNDHVHMVASVPPKIALSKFIGQIKAVTATKFNKSGHPLAPLFWQAEYAVFSLDRKRLPNYVHYVENQKRHHADRTTIQILERISGEGVMMIRETAEPYSLADDEWRRELALYELDG